MRSLFLTILLIAGLASAVEPTKPVPTPENDVIANPSGKGEDVDPKAVVGWQKGYKQTLKLQMKDLEIKADFPLNSRHPFQISGYDNHDNPYTLEVKTAKNSGDTFQVDYSIQRGNKKESGGSIKVKKGKLGKIEVGTNDILDPVIVFETKVTN